jgi:hypothetical protein
MDTSLVIRIVERNLIVSALALLTGALSLYLGYRLFQLATASGEGEAQIRFSSFTIILSRIGPGVFFALFGAAIITFALFQQTRYSEKDMLGTTKPRPERTGSVVIHEQTTEGAPVTHEQIVSGAAATAPDMSTERRHDDQVRLRGEFAVLNRIEGSLDPSLSQDDHAEIAATIRTLKLFLMEKMWTSEWGDDSEFRKWIDNGATSTPPNSSKRAVEYFYYPQPPPQQ